jgi:hypothetical protein
METNLINNPFSEQEIKKFKEALKAQKNTGYDLDFVENNQTAFWIPLSLRRTFLNEECQKDYLKNILPDLKVNFFDNSVELTEKYLRWLGGEYEKLLLSTHYDPNASHEECYICDELTTEEIDWFDSLLGNSNDD